MRPMLTAVASTLIVTTVLVSGCRKESLQASTSALRLAPGELDFEPIYVGDSVERELSVINDGRTALNLEWTRPDGPFTLVNPPLVIGSGETVLRVRFEPTTPGPFAEQLRVGALNVRAARAKLSGIARAVPACPSTDCATSTFVRSSQRCEPSPLPDGTACDAQTLCVVNASCQSGRCIGASVDCDDKNACTVDLCNALTGCENLPAPPCPGDGVCQVGVCHPASGCGLEPAKDAVPCGPLQTCNAAEICMAGQCVVRDPPEGYVCEEASPCQAEARCVSDVCVRASQASTLQPSWRFDSQLTADAGVSGTFFHDFVLEPTGELTLGNFFQSPMLLRANGSRPLPAPLGASRRCIIWGGRLVCADYPASPNGRVTALDQSSGAVLWTYDVRTAKPEWVAITAQIFMTRLVVQGSDRLAALFEAYPISSLQSKNTQCRNYFLVVLDASGQQVMAQRVTDPLLDVCNHPHAYGVASDAVGNLFIAFSPTRSPQAPLVPDRPVLLMSYTHDGIFRWKLTDYSMRGGELAIARGLLYPENSSVALMAATGQPVFALPEELGRVVVSETRLIPAPVAGGCTLQGYEAGIATRRWSHGLRCEVGGGGVPEQFWSDQLRLATWRTSRGPRTVALTFTSGSGGGLDHSLYAIDVNTGRLAFACPVNMFGTRTPPQLFEVGDGSIGVMTGAMDPDSGLAGCGKCDPPYAGSAAEFFSFPLPGISTPDEPWVGTFGGASHDHREDTPTLPPN